MKNLLASLILAVCSTSAFAAIDLRKPVSLEVVNKDGVKTTMTAVVMIPTYKCGPSARCMGGVDSLSVQLIDAGKVVEQFAAPIVNKQTTKCGDIIYTAKEDNRPVDGGLVQIQVSDNTGFKCESYARVNDIDVLIDTDIVSRMEGKEISHHYQMSSLDLGQVATTNDASTFNLAKGADLPQVILSKSSDHGSAGFVQISKAKKTVYVSYQFSSCPQPGDGTVAACPAVIMKREFNLKLDSVKKDACGSVIYHAVTKVITMGGEYVDVTISDNRKNTCENVWGPVLTVQGRISWPNPNQPSETFTLVREAI